MAKEDFCSSIGSFLKSSNHPNRAGLLHSREEGSEAGVKRAAGPLRGAGCPRFSPSVHRRRRQKNDFATALPEGVKNLYEIPCLYGNLVRKKSVATVKNQV